jgi:hypothetical protein
LRFRLLTFSSSTSCMLALKLCRTCSFSTASLPCCGVEEGGGCVQWGAACQGMSRGLWRGFVVQSHCQALRPPCGSC